MSNNIELKHSVEMGELSEIHGIGAIVLNRRHQVLVGTELQLKPDHERQVGQASIPMETLKAFEKGDRDALILAALSEFVTDENIERVRGGLREAGLEGPVSLSESGLIGAIAIFHWIGDPDEMPFCPSDPTETADLRWMDPVELAKSPDVRPFASIMLAHAAGKDLLNGLPNRPIPMLDTFSPSAYFAAREREVDIA